MSSFVVSMLAPEPSKISLIFLYIFHHTIKTNKVLSLLTAQDVLLL